MRRWLLALAVLLLGRGGREREPPPPVAADRVLPEHLAPRGAETLVIALLLGVAAAATLFVVAYLVEPSTQLLGLALGAALALLSAALIVSGRLLVPQEEHVEERSELVHEEEQAEVAAILREGATGISRRRLLGTAAGAAGVALGAALVVPAGSLGPGLGTERLLETPWRRGRRLVDERGRVLRPDDVALGVFLTAFAEGAEKDTFDSPLVLVRLPEEMIEVRRDWAADGVLAFSKICPHAGCAISLYRWPLFEPTSPGPALVCPCHYSTFEPHRGGRLVFGPAGRDLPQLPLQVAEDGELEAAGPFPVGVGPSWWGVRLT